MGRGQEGGDGMTEQEPQTPQTCGLGCELPAGHEGDHDDLLGNTWPRGGIIDDGDDDDEGCGHDRNGPVACMSNPELAARLDACSTERLRVILTFIAGYCPEALGAAMGVYGAHPYPPEDVPCGYWPSLYGPAQAKEATS